MSNPDRYEPLPSLLQIPGWLLRKLPPERRRWVGIALAATGVALVAVLTLVIVDASRDRSARTASEARAHDRAFAARRAQWQREARPHKGSGPPAKGLSGDAALRARRGLVSGLEGAILADARARADRGELKGDFRDADCFRYPKGLDASPPQDDLSLRTVRLECLAVIDRLARNEQTTGSLIGQPFRARVDFNSGRYAWCKVIQRPGELSFDPNPVVKLARSCGGQ